MLPAASTPYPIAGAASPVSQAGPMTFDCPRCRAAHDSEFYGPCADCRVELCSYDADAADNGRHEALATAPGRFEPTMHVTPNAAALKND